MNDKTTNEKREEFIELLKKTLQENSEEYASMGECDKMGSHNE